MLRHLPGLAARRLTRGFSLVELMVSITVGLIVAAAAVALIVSIDRANSETIQSTRLTEELRSLASVIAGDLQRARGTFDPIASVGAGSSGVCPITAQTTPTAMQPCYKLAVSSGNDCVQYGYSGARTAGDAYGSSGTLTSAYLFNYRAISLVNNTIRMAATSIDPTSSGSTIAASKVEACPTSSTVGTAISSPQVKISSLCFSDAGSGGSCYFDTSTNPGICKLNTALSTPGGEVDLCIAGSLQAGDVYTKTVTRGFVEPIFINSSAL